MSTTIKAGFIEKFREELFKTNNLTYAFFLESEAEVGSASDDYLRTQLREDGFAHKLFPPKPVIMEEIDENTHNN